MGLKTLSKQKKLLLGLMFALKFSNKGKEKASNFLTHPEGGL